MGMSYIIVISDNDSSIIFGVLFVIFLDIYILCIKNIITENMMFWIGVTCIGVSAVCLILGMLFSQQIILFGLLMLFAGITNNIGGIIVKYI
nr:MAG TPA: hypothetical protein [Caudoviricetes sp.]